MKIRPTLNFNFASGAEWVDPRIIYSRTGAIGPYYDRYGTLRQRPANSPRISWSPSSGRPQGMVMEAARTNLLLWSEDFSNGAWTKTGATIGSNAATAPDGNVTADTITASAANGAASQAITINANNSISFALYLKAGPSQFAILSIANGADAVQAWINLANGSVGTTTPGANTVLLAFAECESVGFGFYRAVLHVYTNTTTAITCAVSPAARDNTAPAIGDALTAWGATACGTTSAYPSRPAYAATTSASTVKGSERARVAFDPLLMSQTAGSIIFEFARAAPGSSVWLAAIGASSTSDLLTLSYALAPGASLGAVQFTCTSGGVQQAALQASGVLMGDSDAIRVALAYAANDFALSVNGAAPQTDNLGALPTGSWTFLNIGNTTAFANGMVTIRRVLYCPQRLDNAVLQALSR